MPANTNELQIIATTGEPSFLTRRTFDAPRSLVFETLTRAEARETLELDELDELDGRTTVTTTTLQKSVACRDSHVGSGGMEAGMKDSYACLTAVLEELKTS